MKRWLPFLLSLFFLFSACSAADTDSAGSEKSAAIDFTLVSTLAEQQLKEEFAETAGFHWEQKSIYVRSADPSHVVVVFSYRSEEENGEYGLEYTGNAQEGYQLLQKGPEVTGKLLEKLTPEKTAESLEERS